MGKLVDPENVFDAAGVFVALQGNVFQGPMQRAAGGGEFSNGFLTKVDDLSAADPTEEYYRSIFTLDYDAGGSVAVDSNGFVYVVGTTSGSMDDQIATGSNDVFLKK